MVELQNLYKQIRDLPVVSGIVIRDKRLGAWLLSSGCMREEMVLRGPSSVSKGPQFRPL